MEHSNALKLIRCIETCYLPRLPIDCDADEKLVMAHYRAHASSLSGRIDTLLRQLADVEVRRYDPESRVQTVTAVHVLLHELLSKGPWSPEGFSNYAALVVEAYTGDSNVPLQRFLQDTEEFGQEIFDAYLKRLHCRLSPTDWKKFPASVEAYCIFLNEIQQHYPHVELNPVKILPAALLLIDDFNIAFKHKGLQACLTVLECSDKGQFEKSNYQQVIYDCLVKVITEKDVDVLKIAFDCLIKLLPLFPPVPWESKWTRFDELVKNVLEDIYVETNLKRKAACLEFLTKLLEFCNVASVRHKKTFDLVICDNLEVCSVGTSMQLLWPQLLLVLKTWLKYCWCIWKLETDKKILSLLFKLLYIQCNEQVPKKRLDELENIIVCIVLLCTKEQQEHIKKSLNDHESAIDNKMYKKQLDHIRKVLADDNTEASYQIETINKCKERINETHS